jgi:hypothetical protein
MRRSVLAALLSAVLVMAASPAVPAVAASHGWRTTLHYRWRGYHRFGHTGMILRANGTLALAEGGRGSWRINRARHRIVLRMSVGCKPVYRGTLHGQSAEGTMRCGRYHGHWFIDRLRPFRR